MGDFMMEVWVFMKRFWLLPVVTVLVLLGIVLTQASDVTPVIYPLFLGVFYEYDDCIEKSYEA